MELLLSLLAAVIIIVVLIIDLGLFQKEGHVLSIREAITWTVVWIALAGIFNAVIYFTLGPIPAIEFLSGYLVEKSLSVDNLFVFLLIFSYFKVPRDYQHKVLFWGIVGAIIFRGVLIYAGIQLIEEYHWLVYLLGIFLILTGLKTLLRGEDTDISLDNNRVLKFLRRYLPVASDYHTNHFFAREVGKFVVTPLFIVLLMIETTDILFALDSIPAILGITQDPFILMTSNLFAILGLRALYFVLDGLLQTFRYLSTGVAVILMFVGFKMLIAKYYEIGEKQTLLFILSVLVISALASKLHPVKTETKAE